MRSPLKCALATVLVASACCLPLLAQTPVSAGEPWRWQDSLVPNAGFALDDATVVHVTTLAAKGEGSLRAALSQPGPVLVVFDVGGIIDLELNPLKLENSKVYLAGQTAPEPGITLIRGGLQVKGSQVVLHHLRVRPGDAGQSKESRWAPDGITTVGSASEVWIDHCSATWAIDENISASGFNESGPAGRRIYIQHCLIGEGLHSATHPKGSHSKGTLVMDTTEEVAIVGNLYTANVERNPVFKSNTSGVVVNNVMASIGDRALHASGQVKGEQPGPPARIAAVGNVVLHGLATKRSAPFIFEGTASIYLKDNEGYDWFGQPLIALRTEQETLTEPPVWPVGLKPLSTTGAWWHVARFVGARPATRDAIDRRIVQAALAGEERIINSQEEVGGYPKLEPTSRQVEVPAKGRQQWLEKLTTLSVYGEVPKPPKSTPLAP